MHTHAANGSWPKGCTLALAAFCPHSSVFGQNRVHCALLIWLLASRLKKKSMNCREGACSVCTNFFCRCMIVELWHFWNLPSVPVMPFVFYDSVTKPRLGPMFKLCLLCRVTRRN
uniref:Putative secreted protein n=1 Tax=Ixodes ricinus TaxID=34613 RepID=A0A6B0UKP4_IXORI